MTKKLSAFFIIVFLFSPLAVWADSALTGAELLENCQVVLDIHDKNMGRVQTENEYLQGTRAGKCEGYLRGVNEARLVEHKLACSFDTNDKLFIVAAVVKYLKDNSNELSLPASVLVGRVYARYFHC